MLDGLYDYDWQKVNSAHQNHFDTRLRHFGRNFGRKKFELYAMILQDTDHITFIQKCWNKAIG